MKYTGAIVLVVAAVLLAISISPCEADTVRMKDGKTYHGKVVAETDSLVIIRTLADQDGETESVTVRLQRRDIKEIISGGPEPQPKRIKPARPKPKAPATRPSRPANISKPKPVVRRPAAGQLDLGRIRRSVVFIRTVIGDRTYCTGSGFVVRDDGVVYTNRHVIERPDRVKGLLKILVGVPSRRNPDILDYFQAKIAMAAGESSGLDFALLKISAKRAYGRFPVMKTSSLGSGLGRPVTVLGYPDGLTDTPSLSVTKGSISSTNVKLDGRNYLQTDAAVNPGNSGGPMINAMGHAIGLVTLRKARADNMGYALRLTEVSDAAKSTIAKIRSLSPEPGPMDPKALAKIDTVEAPKGAPSGTSGFILEKGVRSDFRGVMTIGNQGWDYWVTSERTLPEDFELTIAYSVRFQPRFGSYVDSSMARLFCVRFGTDDTAAPLRSCNGWTVWFNYEHIYLYQDNKFVTFKNDGNSDRATTMTIVKRGGKHTVHVDGKLMLTHMAAPPPKGRHRFSIGGFESRLVLIGVKVKDLSDKPRILPREISALTEALESPDWARRNDAVVRLGGIGAAAIPALLQAASDKHPFVRERAVEYLGKLVPKSKSALPAVLKIVRSALADEAMEVRRSGLRAVMNLGQAGAPLIDDVIKAANVKSKPERATTNDIALHAVKSMGPACLPEMVQSVCDGGRVKKAAIGILIGSGAHAVPMIIKAFKDAKTEAKLDFIGVLKRLVTTDQRVSGLMKTVLDSDDDWRVREAVVKEFGAAKNDKIALQVIAAMKDDRAEVRKAANDMLMLRAGDGDDKAAAALTEAATEHEDWEVRRSILSQLIKQRSKNFTPTMIKALGDRNANIRRMAVQWLGKRSDLTEDVIPPLLKMLDDESDSVRYGAVCTLARIKSSKVIAPLGDVLKNEGPANEKPIVAAELCKRGPAGLDVIIAVGKDPDSPGHSWAITALSRIKPLPPKAVALFTELAQSKSSMMKRVVMSSLAGIPKPDKTLLKVFMTGFSDPDRTTASSARTGLRKCGEAAIPGLIEMLGAESVKIRNEAIRCLLTVRGKFGPHIPALREAYLKETEACVRVNIVELIGKNWTKDASEVLHMVVLKEAQRSVWCKALEYLKRTGEPLVLRYAKLLVSGDEETRLRTIQILEELRSVAALAAMETALDDKVLLVRIRAALILARSKRSLTKVTALLTEGMGIDDKSLANYCRRSLLWLGDPAIPALAKELTSDNEEACRRALADLGDLRKANPKKILEVVKTARTHKFASVRRQAACILAAANGLTEELLPEVVEHLIASKSSHRYENLVRKELSKFGDLLIPLLAKGLDHPDKEARLEAVRLIGTQIGNARQEVIELLTKAKKDKESHVRGLASYLLKMDQRRQNRK